ncbi:unnamed protein product [Diatraea saccharalis]|uniref:Cathepsin propeptide inhibitor domain-containing protein n=1 Tax=Diatraea saccharalis TaxID=40085 RepID=A0A9N9QYS8_9NEOP|nr:unnamed protein product [Diatraea saccharalis]
MKTVTFIAILLVAVVAFVNAGNVHYDLKDAPYLFHKFVRDFEKRYKDTEEVMQRYATFLVTLKKLNEQNVSQPTAEYTINKFSDYNDKELEQTKGLLPVAVVPFVNAKPIVHYDIKDAPYLFHKFVKEYNRTYHDTEEVLRRYAQFIVNLKIINDYNARSTSDTYGINQFSDYFQEEIEHTHGLRPRKEITILFNTTRGRQNLSPKESLTFDILPPGHPHLKQNAPEVNKVYIFVNISPTVRRDSQLGKENFYEYFTSSSSH